MRITSVSLEDGDVFTVSTPAGDVIVDYEHGESLFVRVLPDGFLHLEVEDEVLLDTGVVE